MQADPEWSDSTSIRSIPEFKMKYGKQDLTSGILEYKIRSGVCCKTVLLQSNL